MQSNSLIMNNFYLNRNGGGSGGGDGCGGFDGF